MIEDNANSIKNGNIMCFPLLFKDLAFSYYFDFDILI